MAKTNRGGARKNAGRPSFYNEPVKLMTVTIPVSKERIIRKHFKAILEKYGRKTKKS